MSEPFKILALTGKIAYPIKDGLFWDCSEIGGKPPS